MHVQLKDPWNSYRGSISGLPLHRVFLRALYSFPIAAITNDYKCRDLKHSFLVSYLGKSEAQNGSHWAEVKVLAELCYFPETLGEDSFLCLFQPPEAIFTA